MKNLILLVNFFTSHPGKTANIICSACFGKGSQLTSAVMWQVNGSTIGNFGEARIREEQEQNQRYFHTEIKTPPTQLQLLSKH